MMYKGVERSFSSSPKRVPQVTLFEDLNCPQIYKQYLYIRIIARPTSLNVLIFWHLCRQARVAVCSGDFLLVVEKMFLHLFGCLFCFFVDFKSTNFDLVVRAPQPAYEPRLNCESASAPKHSIALHEACICGLLLVWDSL